MTSNRFQYRFSYGDAGLSFELYIPTSYEPQLRDLLEKGFDHDTVVAYLTDEKNMREIKDLNLGHGELSAYTAERVQRMQQILWGFSIYRGDGAFFDGNSIDRDSMSIVRLMFLAPLLAADDAKREQERFAASEFLRFWTHDLDRYLEHRHAVSSPVEAWERKFLDRLKDWLDDIALLLNGYVAHQLCRETLWRHSMGLVRKPEGQIWISSLRGLAVSKMSETSQDRANN